MSKIKSFIAAAALAVCLFSGYSYTVAQSVNDCVGLGLNSALAEILCGAKSIAGNLIPDTDDSYDLGSASLEFQDAFFDGTVTTDGLVNSGTSALAAVTATGTITGTSATGIGWTVESGANTACNTTCGAAACVFGADTATDFDAVECDGATADICICAGSAS